ncbi:MAG TPA: signal peptidase I [Lentisphaeria bacterium]|nr:signal peptidase I [Lentisphaeria bacterium]
MALQMTGKIEHVLMAGVSMNPVLYAGDIVELVETERSSIQSGDIIVFPADNGKMIIHRVVRTEPELVTRGDNCIHDDSPVPPGSPVKKAVARLRCGVRMLLTGGVAGEKEFHRNQRHLMRWRRFRNLIPDILQKNPFRLSCRFLKQVKFPAFSIYYFGSSPVLRIDSEGCHWIMRGGRCLFRPPQQNRTKDEK